MWVTVFLLVALVALLFAVIACDEVRRLGRLVEDQHHALLQEVASRTALETRVIALERGNHPSMRSARLRAVPSRPELIEVTSLFGAPEGTRLFAGPSDTNGGAPS